MEEYKQIESIKLHLIQLKAVKAKKDIRNGNLVDGEQFFDELITGKYDK